jgi:hypothetical protein
VFDDIGSTAESAADPGETGPAGGLSALWW